MITRTRISIYLILFFCIAQVQGSPESVKLQYVGLPSYYQSGSLHHDGSIGPTVPISMSVEFEIPIGYWIWEKESERSISIPGGVQLLFNWGNYSVDTAINLYLIQSLDEDYLKFLFHYNMKRETFEGILYDGPNLITDFSVFPCTNNIYMWLWFSNQGATLENVWQKLHDRLPAQARATVNWTMSLDSTGSIYASSYGSDLPNGPRGWSLTVGDIENHPLIGGIPVEGLPEWFLSEWFGYYNTDRIPWLFHAEHGWLYCDSQSTNVSLYFYDDSMAAWWWTNITTYPFLYRFSDGVWLWYREGSSDPRWFFNYTTDSWESFGFDSETSVSSSLESSDPDSHGRNGKANYFTLEGSGSVTIDLMSEDFNCYLLLYDQNKQQVASDDDGAGDGNSRITYTLQSGQTYYVEATSYSTGDYGNYTISVSSGTLSEIANPFGIITVASIDFIDDIPDYSLDSNTDSDNFFLREYDDADLPDSEDLDIYYRILPEDVSVSNVQIRLYRGNTSTLEATLIGEKDVSGDFKTGYNLHTTWTAPVDLPDDHPGFYRVQLEVYIASQTEPIDKTSIDDADPSTDGWQCPQDGLAIHDLTWKHRPVLHVHDDEIGSPSSIDEFLANSGDITGPRVKEWTDGETPTVYPTGSIPVSRNAFWDLFFDDKVTNGDLTSYTQEQIDALTTDPGEETVYHSGNTTDANNFVFLQFWMFENFSRRSFGYAGPLFNPDVQHEGDLEHCQITIRLSDSSDSSLKAKWVVPFGATASQHYYAQTLKWDLSDGSAPTNAHSQEHVEHINNRLAIYVAWGAHATYFAEDPDIDVPEIGGHLGTQQQYEAIPVLGYDVTGPANEIEYDMMHIDDTLLGSFEGRWGYLLNADPDLFSNGPSGPPHRAAHHESGEAVMLRTRPRDLHNQARKTSQRTEMNIP